MTDPFRRDGKRAFVTGADTGIGQAISISLSVRGAHVLAAGRSPCDETVALIVAAGGSAEGFPLKLSDAAAAAKRLSAAGKPDILVNNAGNIGGAAAFRCTSAAG